MWSNYFRPQAKRKRLYQAASPGPLREYYARPFTNKKSFITEIEIVAMDFETTGLNPDQDHIVSIGLVKLENLSIRLNSCWHRIIYTPKNISEQSVVIHQITDDDKSAGISITQVIPALLELLQGRVLLLHHASTEKRFLNRICESLYGQKFFIPTIDTENIAKRTLGRWQQPIKSGDLRLFNLCRQYNLPLHTAHNALYDAILTAELFLALLAENYPAGDCRLQDLLCGY